MDRLPLLSPDWYRVAFIRPRLRPGVRVTRQRVRDETWYVLSDPLSGRHYRFNAVAYGLIASCDGKCTIDEIWSQRVDSDAERAPTQGQTIEVYAQAFNANLFAGDIAPDARAAMRVRTRQQSQRRRAALNPLAFRIPLWDPDRLLEQRIDGLRWLFGPAAWRCMLVLMLLGAALLAWNGSAFGRFAHEQFDHGRLLIAMWIVYPLIKGVHEMAHAFAVKAFGGEVHEMGITLLMLTPVPYVDASASSAFADKHQRAAVGAAGIVAEALLASVGIVLWLLLEPGLAQDLAFAVAFVGSVSTVLVNGNPLLRFDGYHVLCDALELPNLAARSAVFWQYQLKRRLLGLSRLRAPPTSRGEVGWLLAFAPASWLYRSMLLATLAVGVAAWHAAAGLALLGLAVWYSFAKPLIAVLHWLAEGGELHGRRLRALAATGAVVAVASALVFTLPMPHRTHALGVVWLPEEALVRPQTDGFVAEWLVGDGDRVQAGAPLLRLINEPLQLDLARLDAQVHEFEVERQQMFGSDALRAGLAADRMQRAMAERASLAQRVAGLELRAAVAGRVAIDERRLRLGQFLQQGEVVAHVLPAGAPLVRALVGNDDISLVRDAPGVVEVALAHGGGEALPAQVERSVPQASTTLPSAALGEAAGGPIAVVAGDASGRTATEARFQIDLRLPADAVAYIGTRAMVTFRHGDSTLAGLSAIALRRAFLRHFER